MDKSELFSKDEEWYNSLSFVMFYGMASAAAVTHHDHWTGFIITDKKEKEEEVWYINCVEDGGRMIIVILNHAG